MRFGLALLAALGVAGAAGAAGIPQIKVLSNRADLVSGGDALVEIAVPPGIDVAQLRLDVSGPGAISRDITGRFARRGNGRFMGLVNGLALGPNILTVRGPGLRGTRLTITNHPIGGPIFSGPQIQPWYCQPGALDAQCNRPVSYSWQYKNTGGSFAFYDPAWAGPPSDLATTTTDEGKTVPYIVRVETGTMDRSEYRIAVLADPASPFDRWAGPPGWNHKIYVAHGGGCGEGHNEAAAPDVMLDLPLSRGYLVMSTALENNQENCNMVVQAESVMMAKEHIVEAYGDVRYLIGMGGSGGSMAQLYMANSYPGLYDGIIAAATYPDAPYNDLLDCPALLRYFEDPRRWAPGVVWTEPQQAAASGLASTSVCQTWTKVPATYYSNTFDPRVGTGCDIPDYEPEKVYHPQNNPSGIRCSIQDYLVNIFGLRPPERWGPIEQQIGRGFAGRPYDNVGVQYGLRALVAGKITAAQFVDLNAKIGAVDIDYGTQAQRVAADPNALAAAYRTGIVNEANHLDRVPILDMPGFVPGDNYEIHDIYKSWALRQRLDAANGRHDNHALWYGPNQFGQISHDVGGPEALDTIDAWLRAVEQDGRDIPLEDKVAENRPAAAADRCEFGGRTTCDAVFGPAGNIRHGAGMADLRNDVVKCQLRPLARGDYPVAFTDTEWRQLEDAFPDGVCDWGKPGVGQEHTVAWMTYAAGPGGQPLGPAPQSEAANEPPTAVLSGPHEGKVNESLTFSAAGSSDAEGGALTYRFDFGDGTVSPESSDDSAHHAYAAPGNYTVTLTVKDADGATGTATQPLAIRTVTLPPGPVTATIAADYDPGNSTVPLTVTFSAVGSTGPEGATLDYTFVFGDGTQSERLLTPTASHTYESAGTYRPYVIVTDGRAEGAVSERLSIVAQIAIVVDPAQQTVAELLSNLTGGLYPLTVDFDASHSKPASGATIANFDFDFGDGTARKSGPNATVRHIYTVAGDYTATVTVTDSAGGTSQATLPIHVGTPNETVAQLRLLGAAAGTAPFTAVFDGSGSTAASGKTLKRWAFDFDGDGTADLTVSTPAEASSVSFVYATPGAYLPTLTVTDDGQAQAVAMAKVLVVEPPPVTPVSGGGGGGAFGLGLLVPLAALLVARRRRQDAVMAFAALLSACGGGGGDPDGGLSGGSVDDAGSIVISTLSNRADLISGDNALVRIELPAGIAPALLTVNLTNPVLAVPLDVTRDFALRANGKVEGLVTGLTVGANELVARLPDGRGAKLTIMNHPVGGPVFSGAQVQPWTCFEGATDAQCNRPTRYQFFYMSVAEEKFLPYYDDAHPYDPATAPPPPRANSCNAVPEEAWDEFPYSDSGYVEGLCERTPEDPRPAAEPGNTDPADIKTTTTDEGKVVPYIVRIETGAMNRETYKVAVLFNPAKSWHRWAPQPAWNRKMLISHGHGCGATYGQGEDFDPLEQDSALSKGYIVMLTSMNNSGNHCNVVVQAESMIMVKEHVIEQYGDVLFTMGSGGSGGALAQQWVANAYPGLYDGVLVAQSFPDAWSTAQEIEDCSLLISYWQDPTRWAPGVQWTEAQKTGVEGHLSTSICQEFVLVAAYHELLDPSVGVKCDIDDADVYDANANPEGARCTLHDYSVNVFGRRAASTWTAVETALGRGFAGRPYDNVGVQYGLAALQEGTITPLQFLDLNAKIGSHDIDYEPQASRVAADREALGRAYRAGMINQGNNLRGLAMIDMRGTDTVEIHHHVRTWVMRARIDREQGHHDNHVSWWGPAIVPSAKGDQTFGSDAFRVMADWLGAIKRDTSSDPLEVKVARSKPAAAADRCTDGNGGDADPSTCQVPDATPRIAAGQPITDDTVSCQLKPLSRSDDYGPVPFTDDQWAQLQTIFPGGVCDYTRPGNEQQPTVPWLRYDDAEHAGGVPMGPAPASVALP